MSEVYLIHALRSDFYKIGFAINVKKRIAGIQTACPFDLKILSTREGSVGTEQAIHSHLKKHHVRGEWFTFASPLQAMYFFAEWKPPRQKRSTVVALDSIRLGSIKSPHGNVRV